MMITVYHANESNLPATHHKGHVPGIYLHGKIEEAAGIDLTVFNRDEYDSLVDGVSEVTVMVNGEQHKCVMFLWMRHGGVVDRAVGMIVDPTDKDACAYAVRLWTEKPIHF